MYTQYLDNSTSTNETTNGTTKIDHKKHQVDTLHADEGYVEQRFETPDFVKSWSEEQKAEFAFQLLLSIPASRSLEVVERLCPLLHRDFFSMLPYELVLHILSFVDAYTLVQMGMVSKYWKKISDDPYIWQALFIKQGWKSDQQAIKKYLDQSLLNKETKNGMITTTAATTSTAMDKSSTNHISTVPLARTNAALYDPTALPKMPGAPSGRLRSLRRPGDIFLQLRQRRQLTPNPSTRSTDASTSTSSAHLLPSSRSTPPLSSSSSQLHYNIEPSHSYIIPQPSLTPLFESSSPSSPTSPSSSSSPSGTNLDSDDLPTASILQYNDNNQNHATTSKLIHPKDKLPCMPQTSSSDSVPKSPSISPLLTDSTTSIKSFEKLKENHYQSPIPIMEPLSPPLPSSSSPNELYKSNDINVTSPSTSRILKTSKGKSNSHLFTNINDIDRFEISMEKLNVLDASTSSSSLLPSNNNNNNNNINNNNNNNNNSNNNNNNNTTNTSINNRHSNQHSNNINNNNNTTIDYPHPSLTRSSSNLRKLSESRLLSSATTISNKLRNTARPPLPIASYSRDSTSSYQNFSSSSSSSSTSSTSITNTVPNVSLSSSALYQRRQQLTRHQYKQLIEESITKASSTATTSTSNNNNLEMVDRHRVVERPFKNRPIPRQHTKYDEAALYHYDEVGDKRYINWRRLYRNRYIIEKRWRNGKYWMRPFPPPNSTGQLDTHVDWIYCLQFDHQTLVSGSRDHTIKVWNMATGVCLHTLIGHQASVLCLQYDDRYIISGSSDTTMIVWDKQSGELLKTLSGHSESVLNLKFNGNRLVSSSKDRTVRIWDLESGTTTMTLIGHRAAVNAIQFKDDLVVSASGDRTIRLWNAVTGNSIRTFDSHSRGIACVEFDGNRIVSGSSDQTIKIWNMETGECLHTLPGHTDLVRTLQMDRQSNRIVTGSYDGSLRIWDMEKGANLRILNEGIEGRVLNLQFDFSKIVCCTNMSKIFIYDFARGIDTQFLA
ncbi:hypothetical protein BJ944DRAFT_8495 [Cunninghamella echinulata]|nr:hypothetical protein BJ944DRAFT_8495 [Cunninghamella echinulata]